MQNVPSILAWLFIMFQPLLGDLWTDSFKVLAKVQSPNYEFKYEQLTTFRPRTPISEIRQKYGPGEELQVGLSPQILKFEIKEEKYKFSIIVQSIDNKVHDVIARLPSYFLHDVFFQSLRNQYGKQTQTKRSDEATVYIWETNEEKHIYSAACTITCFPISYAMESKPSKIKTLLNKMKSSY